MDKIIVDKSKCVGCGECARDCVASAIYVDGGKAHLRTGCIECGHCFAVCPAGAITMSGYSADDCGEVVPMTAIDSGTLLQAMKSRRTIRQFKDEPIDREMIDKILEAGRYAPTGANSQNVAFTILGSKQESIERECVSLFRKGVGIGAKFSAFLRNMDINDSFFFKKAPLVIVVSGHDAVNATLASAYMEIEANSLGLGVLYSGFFCFAAKMLPKVRKALNLPKGHTPVTCMIFGWPDVKYKRVPPRKERKVTVL